MSSTFLEIDQVDRIFKLPSGGEYIALKGIDLKIKQGEFISLVGHSGCGKSTLLNIIAGLDRSTNGGVVLEGREVSKPGRDRMVVFQNYSLLAWKTVYQNIALAVDTAYPKRPQSERKDIVEQHIDLVGLRPAAHKYPKELSGGMKQRVAIARALSIRPKVLLLDEPFGALDALTRGNLQEQLMRICQEGNVTAVMVTHDVDEALLLSDRVVLLTNGPQARIGQILDIPIPRPRDRMEVVKHHRYYALRNEIIYFLNQQKRAKKVKFSPAAAVAGNGLEKVNLNLGFIPLTDSAPLIVAQELGFFKEYGLEQVTLSREPSWGAVSDGLRDNRLDGAIMVAGMPLAMTMGVSGKPVLPMITAMVVSRNGNAITLGKKAKEAGVRTLADFKAFVDSTPRNNLGMVHPASMQNLLLRYWLAAGGIDPDEDVELSVIPPPQMVATLKSGSIDGYCVGDPWNSWAVKEGLGFIIATDLELWRAHPEKVLGVREDWVEKYPQTHLALVKAIMNACEYCDDFRNRPQILEILARPEYIGAPIDYIRPGFLDQYDRGLGEAPASLLRFNQFYVDRTNCPGRGEALWILTQLARWNLAPFPKNWVEVLERVRRLDLFSEAARAVGWPDVETPATSFTLFDGVTFDPNDPLGYLEKLPIKRSFSVEEIQLDR
ncbi:MAG: nitrate ABC transporter ATP-binding protein [Prochlorotrichaceae cyanobacterium]